MRTRRSGWLALAGAGVAIALGSRLPALGTAQPPSSPLAARLAASERAAIAKLPRGTGRDLILGNCITCHSASLILVQHKDTAGWNRTVTQMMTWGATLPPEKKPELIAYLFEHYPARATMPAPTPRP